MTVKEGMALAWAHGQLMKALAADKSDLACMLTLKRAYKEALKFLEAVERLEGEE